VNKTNKKYCKIFNFCYQNNNFNKFSNRFNNNFISFKKC
jgi:hypothetical protein